jgi:hypothetical protein
VASDGKIQIGEIATTFTWLMTPIGLLIDEATITGGPVTIDIEELERSQGDLKFEAIIRNKSIEVFLEKLQPGGLHDFKVNVQPDGIHLEAIKTVLVPIQATAHAILKLDDEDSVSVELLSAEAFGAALKNMVANQIEQINPVVKTDMFPFPVQFKEIIHEDGFVRLLGEGQLSETNEE